MPGSCPESFQVTAQGGGGGPKQSPAVLPNGGEGVKNLGLERPRRLEFAGRAAWREESSRELQMGPLTSSALYAPARAVQ